MADKQTVRPIYSELQGSLAQAPGDADHHGVIYDAHFWEHYNTTIDELNEITKKNYDRYKLKPSESGHVLIATYKQKMGSLIARLYGEYFSDEVAPFTEMPSTIITQSQNQNQSVHVQLLLEMNNLINEKLGEVVEGSKEKTFLEKIKSSLSSVKDVGQLVSLLVTTAHQLGITVEQLKHLFGL